MNYAKGFLLIAMTSLFATACKKDDKPKVDLSSPAGYFQGTRNIGGAAAESFSLLLRPDKTCREYVGAAGTTDTTTMQKRDMLWTFAGTTVEIFMANYYAIAYRAQVPAPINGITGSTGIYSLGTFQGNGSFAVTRK